jgi:hypothetical protein
MEASTGVAQEIEKPSLVEECARTATECGNCELLSRSPNSDGPDVSGQLNLRRKKVKRVSWFTLSLLLVGLMANQGMAQETRLRARLAGPAINGLVPGGNAEFRSRPGRAKFKAQAEDVNLPDGTVLMVKLNGNAVGTLTLALRRGELELNTQDGQTVPSASSGDIVTICDANGVVLLSGQLR